MNFEFIVHLTWALSLNIARLHSAHVYEPDNYYNIFIFCKEIILVNMYLLTSHSLMTTTSNSTTFQIVIVIGNKLEFYYETRNISPIEELKIDDIKCYQLKWSWYY
uniref:Uncharacterized protein n=1 Tax=Cacopsylla melanoneura TaxID=428564 RepID=A0A8D8RH35_9HEMI